MLLLKLRNIQAAVRALFFAVLPHRMIRIRAEAEAIMAAAVALPAQAAAAGARHRHKQSIILENG